MRQLRLLVLVTDAYGGRGGIAQVNQDVLHALSSYEGLEEAVVFPRIAGDGSGTCPPRISFRRDVAGSKLRYVVSSVLRSLGGRIDGVICGHLNLIPVAATVAWLKGAPLVAILHGMEAWAPTKSHLHARLLRRVHTFVAVSDTTWKRFAEWAPSITSRHHIVPNCVDFERFRPGEKKAELVERYGLQGATVLLTVARLDDATQRPKGIDEVIECLPDLLMDNPSLRYLIVGEGVDLERFRAKAIRLGVGRQVVFAGFVSDDEKVDHYRLADAFVMPGRGEGFGLVYTEAIACGVPVVASTLDASAETLLNGRLGELVDPRDLKSVANGIRIAVGRPKRERELARTAFSREAFQAKWHAVVESEFARVRRASG